jgi:uncharacterized protein YdcH (DUF465 family)
MSHVEHELPQKFPEKIDKMREMKMSDAHFSRLYDEYHEINRRVHRIEARGVDRSESFFEDLKKKRIFLLDELTQMLMA